jgi:outer membrane protein OmpA-like peptidoglycan-associated protein
MPKGVKKIKWNSSEPGGAGVYSKLSMPNKLLTIEPDKFAWFSVNEWYSETTKEEREKNLTWIRQDGKEKFIIKQMVLPAKNLYGFRLEKKLCGPYTYYIEASMSGKRDLKNETGLYVRGYCSPKIIDSKWSTSNDGKDERSRLFSYGEKLFLGVNTEGLNGNMLTVEIFRFREGSYITGKKKDNHIRTIANVEVIDGEINLEIDNTSLWKANINDIEETEKFYIKIKDTFGNYIKDDKNDIIHARFLRIKNKSVPQTPKKPTNNTPVKVGETEVNKKQNELCRFSTISITETQKKDGKEEKTKVEVYNEGTALNNNKISTEIINQTVFFEFDQSVLTTDSKKVLDGIVNYLIINQSSVITLEGYACVIGKQDYNKELSFARTAAVKKYLIDGGISQRRIICNAKGEIQLYDGKIIVGADDDKNGKDNISHKEEKNYVEARRVDISFLAYTHNADTIVYHTIAPSKFKDILIEVKGYDTKACHQPKNEIHKKKIKVNSVEYIQKGGIEKEADNLAVPVRSSLATWNPAPLQYIWPSISTPTKYFVDIHSCRYFTNNKYNTILIKAYPDIHWKFDLYVNLSNKLSVKWQKLSKERHAEMRSNALKLANEAKGKYTEVDFGFKLEAKFDKNKDGVYGSNRDLTFKYTDKIKKLFSLISSVKEISQGITSVTKGKISKTKSGTNLPFIVEMLPPVFHFGTEWEADVDSQHKEIGTKIILYLQAEPFVGLSLTIDLLCMALQAGVAVATGGTGNAAALKIFKEVREWAEEGYESENVKISLKMYIDLVITGTIEGKIDGTFSTVNKSKEANFELASKLGVELKAGLNLRAMIVVIGTVKKPEAEAHAEGELSVSVKIGITSGHTLKYDSSVGVFYQPKLEIDPCVGQVILKIKVGFSYKKISSDWTPLDYNHQHEFFPKFDIVDSLSKMLSIDNKVLIWPKKQ